MLRVSVIYPSEPGKRFDLSYYTSTHANLVNEKLRPLGLLRFEVDEAAGDDPAFLVKADMVFDSATAFDTAMAAVGADLMADVSNFTDIESIIQVSNVLVSA